DCFVALEISAILAPSFGAIYFRNAVNSGFPLLRSAELDTLVLSSQMETGDRITLDFGSSEAKNLTKESPFTIETMSGVQSAIFKSSNLFGYGKTLDRE
ncbi:MAG: 3-isopropylmalate dehydratase, partial [Candidatus Aminicenantes bacterium]|nr:3-isopropylmalate dehydratase [Candidatus Aminicenantes bacterium]